MASPDCCVWPETTSAATSASPATSDTGGGTAADAGDADTGDALSEMYARLAANTRLDAEELAAVLVAIQAVSMLVFLVLYYREEVQ